MSPEMLGKKAKHAADFRANVKKVIEPFRKGAAEVRARAQEEKAKKEEEVKAARAMITKMHNAEQLEMEEIEEGTAGAGGVVESTTSHEAGRNRVEEIFGFIKLLAAKPKELSNEWKSLKPVYAKEVVKFFSDRLKTKHQGESPLAIDDEVLAGVEQRLEDYKKDYLDTMAFAVASVKKNKNEKGEEAEKEERQSRLDRISEFTEATIQEVESYLEEKLYGNSIEK